jgi:CheY-like chemotaxis protein
LARIAADTGLFSAWSDPSTDIGIIQKTPENRRSRNKMNKQEKVGCDTSGRTGAPTGTRSSLFRVLVVDDNPGDINLIREAIRDSGQAFDVQVVLDGRAALESMQRMYASPESLHLVFLDLNMPRMDGFAVLAALRADAKYDSLPVVVFSTSSDPADVRRASELRASRFLTKPNELESYIAAIQECCRSCVASSVAEG